jgi:hypothetical protein
MSKLHYTVEVRDKDFKLYKTESGSKVFPFTFEDNRTDVEIVEAICRKEFDSYKAVCKEGSEINIEVRYFNDDTKTYPLLYSFYGAENKFIKH